MPLLTTTQRAQLLTSRRTNTARLAAGQSGQDFVPVVKLFTAFGLCDLGLGGPALGYVSLKELATVRGRLDLPVERDHHFTADKPLSVHAEEAQAKGGIAA
jgi:hypothetical protein